MAVVSFPSKAKERIYKQFPTLSSGEMTHSLHELKIIEYEKKRIEEYDVVFWHRLLKTIYQEPLEMECELYPSHINAGSVILRKLEEKSKWAIVNTSEEVAMKIACGDIKPIPVNWKYYFRLPGGGIIECGTKDKHTLIYFAHVVPRQLTEADRQQAERFISLLLDEAKKEANNKLFDPVKELERNDNLNFYLLLNVYRSNYISAEQMLATAVIQEEYLRNEFLKYDARTADLYDEDKREHMDKFMLACGMYFSSAISYFFMAVEGFLNILLHSFLKKNLRASGLKIEERFDIEQKLKLLPVLCEGFLHEHYNAPSALYSKFRKLTDYRNSMFHSKIEEALRNLVFIEDGFIYNCDMSRYKEQFLPVQKINLSADDVSTVKNIVDEIINLILNSMTTEVRHLTDEFIMKSTTIPFYILSDGSLAIGRSGKEQDEQNLAQQKNQPDRE